MWLIAVQVCSWHFKLVQQNILWATPLYFCASTHNYHIINPGCVFTEVKLKAKKASCKDVTTLPEWLISDTILDLSSSQLLPLGMGNCNGRRHQYFSYTTQPLCGSLKTGSWFWKHINILSSNVSNKLYYLINSHFFGQYKKAGIKNNFFYLNVKIQLYIYTQF